MLEIRRDFPRPQTTGIPIKRHLHLLHKGTKRRDTSGVNISNGEIPWIQKRCSSRSFPFSCSDAESKTDLKNKEGGSHGSRYARYLHRATGRYPLGNCTALLR